MQFQNNSCMFDDLTVAFCAHSIFKKALKRISPIRDQIFIDTETELHGSFFLYHKRSIRLNIITDSLSAHRRKCV